MNAWKNTIKSAILWILSALFSRAIAQCPVTDFTAPSTYCEQGAFMLTNTSEDGSYLWDFCTGDLANTPTASSAFTVAAANGRPGIDFAKDGDVWYGFLTGTYSNALTRLTFANGLNQPPTNVEDLGDLGGVLDGPGEIRILEEGGVWYGLLLNTTSGDLIRLFLGDHLTNNIDAAVLKTGLAYTNSGLAVGRDATDGWIAVVTTSANELVMLRLGTDIHAPGPGDTQTTSTFAGGNNLGSVDLIETCGNWYGLAANFGTGDVYALNFGAQLFSLPSVNQIVTLPISNPGKIRLADDGDKFYALVTSIQGHFLRLDFHTDLTSTPDVTDEDDVGGVLSSTQYGLGIVYENSNWNAWAVDESTGSAFRIHYPDNCTASPAYSTSSNPLVVYEGSGNFEIGLKNTTGSGTGRMTRAVTINSSLAPDIALSSIYNCAQNPVSFTSENASGNISTYQWDFGDSGTSTGQNPTHSYTTAGSYPVELQVGASNGCTNIALDTVRVYSRPVANFALPAISPLCTNQPYTYLNNSTIDTDSPISWSWQVDGVEVSSSKDLVFSFPDTSPVNVKLVASIPGCFDSYTESISTIYRGPSVDFSFSGQCQNSPITFSSETEGTVSGYAWDFGEGSMSSQANPSHTYPLDNNYVVTLSATTTDGCENFKTKTVPVYQQPQPDFTLELPPFSCSGSPSQFDDATPNPTDSNIASWSWDFGDTGTGNTSTTRNPQHTYADAGDYSVSLETTTNFGCSATTQEMVSIAPSPSVAYTYAPACVDEPTQFTDQSGTGVTEYSWDFGGSFSSMANPLHTFSTSGDYTVSLSVTGDNDCIAQTSQLITVPGAPSLDFSYIGNCAGNNSSFSNLSTSQSDPAVDTEWTFEGVKTNGNTVTHTFAATGAYAVVMNLTTQSGCVYQLQKTVMVGEAPSASFTVPFAYGTSPFKVPFTNTSTQATSYEWNFDDAGNSTSTQKSPVFTFSAVGDYEVSLIAANDAGCSDTVSQAIHVVVPEKDIALADMKALPQPDGTMALEVTVINNGNLPIIDLPITLDLSTGTIPETIDDVILPGTSLEYTFQVHVSLSSGHNYVCVYVDDTGDEHPEDNTACLTLSDPVVFYAHPNPAGEKLMVDWIGSIDSSVRIRLVDLRGQSLADSQVDGHEGYNQVIIQTAAFDTGLYLLEWQMGNIRKISRIFVQH